MGQAAADQHIQTYEAPLRAADGVQTNASGTAAVALDPETCEGRYAILADCLRNATKITIRIQGSIVREQTLDGPVTRGLVRNEIITHRTFTRDDFEEHTVADLAAALREHQVTITVHTKQHPDGELRGHLKPVDEPTIELPDEPADETDEDEDDDRAEFYTFEVTLTVVDEDGDPVEGELVERRTVGRVDWIEVGRTDENGEIVSVRLLVEAIRSKRAVVGGLGIDDVTWPTPVGTQGYALRTDGGP